MMRQRLVAVIPAFNEAPAIAAVVQEVLGLRRDGVGLFESLVVVDNGSTDGTGEVAGRHGARVVRETRRGYGAACLAGIAAAGDADAIVFIDGDASVELGDTHRLLASLAAGADLVIGARLDASPAAMSFPQRFGNRLATTLIRWLWRAPVRDLGPFRVIRRSALQALDMRDRTYGWTVEMQVKAIQRGLRTVEVPVGLRPRIGRSKISGTVSGVIGAAIGIFSMIGRLWLAQRVRGGAHPRTTKENKSVSTFMKSLAGVSLALAAAAGAYASGTVSPGGASAGRQQLYNVGKAVYARELACGSCPYADAKLSADLARRILSDQNSFGALEPAKQEAVREYFRKRLGVDSQ